MNLAAIIISKRREKKITQEALAAHVGVSKASVSKWETGASYPDIAHLPIIAAYFDISIDQLMNYSPQLTDVEIKKLYTKLAKDFATKPWAEALEACDLTVKKYYSCHSLVLYIAQLYLNHATMTTDAMDIYHQALKLCQHVSSSSRDANRLQEAAMYQALCHLALNQPQEALNLLADEDGMPKTYCIGTAPYVSQAHQMLGNLDKAMEIEQLEILMSMTTTFNGLLAHMQLNLADYETALRIFKKAETMAETFNMVDLNANAAAILHVLEANMYQMAGEGKLAIQALKKYVDICVHSFFPFSTKGGEFFNKIGDFIAAQEKIAPLPRSEETVKASMLNDVMLNPIFDSLQEDIEFINLVQKLKNYIGGK